MMISIDGGPTWLLAAGTDTAALITELRDAMTSDHVVALPVVGPNTTATILLRARTVTSVFIGEPPHDTFKSGIVRLGGTPLQDPAGSGGWPVMDASISDVSQTLERAMRDNAIVQVAVVDGVLLVNGRLLDSCITQE